MFTTTQHRTLIGAAGATLRLIHTVTAHNLRKNDRNPIIGLLMTAVRAAVMIAGFMGMYYIVGVRRSPLRGDFLIYVMTGIFLYQAHTMAVGAVAGAGSGASAIMKHGPMNTAVVLTSAALAALYRALFSALLILGVYRLFVPFRLESPLGCLAMLLLAWASGVAVGLMFYAIRPWSPQTASIGSQVYTRLQMIASGKMFVANAMPGHLIDLFDFNPLFHVIDQARGYAFINYSPHHSEVPYPFYWTLVALMIGLMAEFVTRQSESISWSAGR